jgi:seryl-tRNA synthetase
MIDTKLLREEFSTIKNSLMRRGFDIDQKKFESIDVRRKSLQIEVENLQSERNNISAEFGQKKKSGESTDELKAKVDQINLNLVNKEEDLNKVLQEINAFLMEIPNTPDESVPIGKDETENVVIKKCGEITTTNKLDHLEITNDIDTELATKLAGARFSVLRGDIAKLQRALITFMLDNAIKNGYQEYYVPFMANVDSLTGTGQLPKFEDDLFKSSDKLFLIPTAEVPLTNLFRDEFLDEKDLPVKVTSHTPCFRSEAGSYGKDTRGLIRQHQFEKIELVQITNPNNSMKCLDNLLSNACEILDLLELPYQIIELCTGDLGFSSCKTFDIEVWMPSQEKYREISSCSNFSDFQARRANIKFKSDGKNQFAHTINGSGLAVGRCLIALIENNFDGKDTIKIPDCLKQYFGSSSLVLKSK